MVKFPEKQRVIFKHDGKEYTGRVTARLHRSRRVVSDTGLRAVVPLRDLKRAPDRVLLLESRLDRQLRSRRIYGPMMKQWLEAYDGVEVLYEKVHTCEDFRLFLRQEGRKPGTRFIHYLGHGENFGAREACLKLTFENLDLMQEADIFTGLEGKVILFSCCEIGVNTRALQHIRDVSRASAVIAYRTDVVDAYTNLTEALLYDRMIAGVNPHRAVEQVSKALYDLGLRAANERKSVLVCL